jgi:putative transcriptional regulator
MSFENPIPKRRSRRKCFYAMLATMLTFAAAEKLNRHFKEFDVPEMDTRANGPSFASSFRAKREMPPADVLPVQSNHAKSLRAGKLLVASRNLGDPYFSKTVILLVRYDGEGVLGLVLNRRTDIPISRALESLKVAKDCSAPVYLGGPVETSALFALFQSPTKVEGAEPIFDGVYLITSKPLFEQTISARPAPGVFHVYLGYAAWTQDQLQKEVELGAWFIFPAEASAVFNADPDSLWLEMIRKTELQLARGRLRVHRQVLLSLTP